MTSVMTRMAARLLLAPVLIIAAAVLVKAASGVGDGFTAGLIAVLAIVIQYLAAGPAETERWLPVAHAPRFAVAGLLLMLAVALQSSLRGEPPLQHWPPPEESAPSLGTLKLTTGFAFDVGVFLLVLGVGLATIRTLFLVEGEEREGER